MDKADTYYLILQIVAPIATLICSVFTLLTILTIHQIRYESAHVVVLKHMSYCGFLFRLLSPWQFIFNLSNMEATWLTVFRVPVCMGETIMLNLLCWSCFHTIWYRKQFDLARYLYHTWMCVAVCSIIIILCLLIPTYVESTSIPQEIDLFGFARNISFLINLILVIMIVYRVYWTSPKHTNTTDDAIRTLTYRLLFYPIVQIITRSGNIWYYVEFGFSANPSEANDDLFACSIYLCFCIILTAVGFFCIFLIMQPTAWLHFQALLGCNKLTDEELESTDSLSLHKSRISRADSLGSLSKEVPSSDGRPSSQSFRSTSNSVQSELEGLRRSVYDTRLDGTLYDILNHDMLANFDRNVSIDNVDGILVKAVDEEEEEEDVGAKVQMVSNPIRFNTMQ